MKLSKTMTLVLCLLLTVSLGAFAAEPAKVEGPITITVWHTRAAGANGDQIANAVARFNATNPYGIVVEEVYQGGYPETLAKTMQSIAAGTAPEIVLLERAAGVPVLATQGVLLDMAPYAERDGFQLDNVPPVLLKYSYYDGQLVAMPYIRSTPLFYYNKQMFAEAGFTEAPKTIEELIQVGRALHKKNANGETEVWGFALLNDPGWFIQNMIYQMGSNLVSEDGQKVICLEDGTMLAALKAWREWVDEGWCWPPTVTRGEATMKDLFNQGKIASYFASSGGMTNILNNAEAVGIEVGVAFLPTWDAARPSAPTGGGNLAIIKQGKNDQQLAAAWEFMKFVMSDAEAAGNAADTGYLPATYGSAQQPVIQELWAKRPEYKVAFDQLEIAQELPWSPYNSEFIEQLKVICSQLIIDRTITPEEAIEALKIEARLIFR